MMGFSINTFNIIVDIRLVMMRSNIARSVVKGLLMRTLFYL